MRVELTKRWQIIGVLLILTFIIGSFVYTLMLDPDAPLKALSGRNSGNATSITPYKQGDAIIPLIVLYLIAVTSSLYYYRDILFKHNT